MGWGPMGSLGMEITGIQVSAPGALKRGGQPHLINHLDPLPFEHIYSHTTHII